MRRCPEVDQQQAAKQYLTFKVLELAFKFKQWQEVKFKLTLLFQQLSSSSLLFHQSRLSLVMNRQKYLKIQLTLKPFKQLTWTNQKTQECKLKGLELIVLQCKDRKPRQIILPCCIQVCLSLHFQIQYIFHLGVQLLFYETITLNLGLMSLCS